MSESIRALKALAEAEHRIAAENRPDDLPPVQDALATALSELPAALDATEHALLAETYALREQTIALLREARDRAAAELARVDQGRSALRAYTPAGVETGPSVDTAV